MLGHLGRVDLEYRTGWSRFSLLVLSLGSSLWGCAHSELKAWSFGDSSFSSSPDWLGIPYIWLPSTLVEFGHMLGCLVSHGFTWLYGWGILFTTYILQVLVFPYSTRWLTVYSFYVSSLTDLRWTYVSRFYRLGCDWMLLSFGCFRGTWEASLITYISVPLDLV